MKTISIILLVISAFLNFKHGWDAFRPSTPEQAEMMSILGVNEAIMPYFGIFSVLIGLMLLHPKTFFISNVLRAIIIVLIMTLSLKAGNYKMALIEIPFLAMPLLLILLKYPFKFN
ncbi:hypothetical protein [Epilithonimonas caeni]|uniref:hypothetical protein n=1 Tax=Epilithonimonas caeni TaxID=365343 RepID=UPI00048617A7|nr:hypothetical protein [Epilithonimonas caeni]